MPMTNEQFFCGNPMCKRTSLKREEETEPWPLRCQICSWLNVPDNQREKFRERSKYDIPTLTSVMVHVGGRLVAYSAPESSGRAAECPSPPVAAPSLKKPPAERPRSPPGASTLLAEMLEAASPALDTPAPLKDAAHPVPSPSPEPPTRRQTREALAPLKTPGPLPRTAKKAMALWVLAFLLGLGAVMAWFISGR